MHLEMQDEEDRSARRGSNYETPPRYAAICGTLKERNGRINVKMAQKILSNDSGLLSPEEN
jgi:hypothetical protein